MFLSSVDSLELKPEQKTAVAAIESDVEKAPDSSKEARAKLGGDVVDGVVVGKLDHKKIDADLAALGTAAAGTVPAMQDAVNRLYKTLDADQRKKLVESLHAKAKEMHEHMGMGMGMGMGGHGMGMPEHGEKDGHGMGMAGHGMGMAEHEGKGPAGHEHEGKGPAGPEHEGKGPAGHEHEGKGPAGHEHEGKGPAGHEHEGMAEGPLMKLGEDLALTPEQKGKLRLKLEAQMKANHAAMKTKMEAAEKQMEAISAAFVGDKFDAKKAGVGVQHAEMMKLMATHHVQFVETILSELTPEQRLKFAEHVKAHVAEMEHAD